MESNVYIYIFIFLRVTIDVTMISNCGRRASRAARRWDALWTPFGRPLDALWTPVGRRRPHNLSSVADRKSKPIFRKQKPAGVLRASFNKVQITECRITARSMPFSARADGIGRSWRAAPGDGAGSTVAALNQPKQRTKPKLPLHLTL